MIEHQSTVGAAKKRLSSRDLALVASFAALIAVLGLPGGVPVFGNAVPVTLQSMGIMLAGSILGWKRGALSVLVLLVLVGFWLACLATPRMWRSSRENSKSDSAEVATGISCWGAFIL